MRIFGLPILTTTIALAAVGLSITPLIATALQFDRSAVLHGQLWRLLTCHLTHWTSEHLAWDVLTFALLGVIAETAAPRRFVACLLLSSVAIPAAVLWARPELQVYRGLSGIDSALFALALAEWFWRGGTARVIAIVAGIALASKLCFETITGQTLFVDASASGFVPVPVAHAAGAVIGIITGTVGRRFFRAAMNLRSGFAASQRAGTRSGGVLVTRLNSNPRWSS